MNIEFIYNVVESKYSNLECYSVYDFRDNNLVEDIKLNKVSIMLDRKNKMIYFMNMNADGHWIIEKNYYYKIIQEFLKQAEKYDCKDYLICGDCSGGELYYKYNK